MLSAFNEIHIVGIQRKGLDEHENWDDKRSIWRVGLGFPLPVPGLKSITLFLKWAAKILLRYRHSEIKVIQCHSLEDLPIGVLLKMGRKNRKLIYDAHELETERNGLSGLNQKIAKLKERLLIHFADEVIVVSESIVDWYKRQYDLNNISLIRNMPYNEASQIETESADPNVFRKKFNIPSDSLIFLYQGAFMKGRCIELMLEVFSKLGPERQAVFMGYGSNYERLIQQYAERFQNIHYQEAVSPQEVYRYTIGADVGLCVLEAICISYYYALPNKLYEYTLAGLPIIASDFPEIARTIHEYDNGWTVPVEPDAIRRFIQGLTRADVQQKGLNSVKASSKIGWHHEEEKLLAVYRNLLSVEP